MFQFTHPRGVRQGKHIHFAGCISFNSRTREGCDLLEIKYMFSGFCFNSRTREGCDLTLKREIKRLSVSIHAPARGATKPDFGLLLIDQFQFTHPRGVRRKSANRHDYRRIVSIHAPARGATRQFASKRQAHLCFNSRTREGCDKAK